MVLPLLLDAKNIADAIPNDRNNIAISIKLIMVNGVFDASKNAKCTFSMTDVITPAEIPTQAHIVSEKPSLLEFKNISSSSSEMLCLIISSGAVVFVGISGFDPLLAGAVLVFSGFVGLSPAIALFSGDLLSPDEVAVLTGPL